MSHKEKEIKDRISYYKDKLSHHTQKTEYHLQKIRDYSYLIDRDEYSLLKQK